MNEKLGEPFLGGSVSNMKRPMAQRNLLGALSTQSLNWLSKELQQW